MKPQDLLFQWLDHRLDSVACAWLREQSASLAAGAPERTLHLAFGMALRKSGHAPLSASAAEQAEALAAHPGWDLRDWTRDQAARAALLLALPSSENASKESASREGASEKTVRAVLALFQTADLGEHVALARALFLLPDARGLLHVAREAIRSNMGDVFHAISQRNPYPAEHFDEIAWNQMIVKCLFVELPLRSVQGLDGRANAALARMATGLARERWAAGRAISPEAWRCVGPFADSDGLSAMETALGKESIDRRGAALGLWSAPAGAGRAIVNAKAPELVAALEAGTLTWENHEQP